MGVATVFWAVEGDVECKTGLGVSSARVYQNVHDSNNAEVLYGISSCAE